jgi:pSer/pThr/pTyr-binding forkhead associated (FHA) protein
MALACACCDDLAKHLEPQGKSPSKSRCRSKTTRHHARILLTNGQATMEDLGRKNGTFLRGNRIVSARLSDGDEIRLRCGSPDVPTRAIARAD